MRDSCNAIRDILCSAEHLKLTHPEASVAMTDLHIHLHLQVRQGILLNQLISFYPQDCWLCASPHELVYHEWSAGDQVAI